jgi:hypothetical protein
MRALAVLATPLALVSLLGACGIQGQGAREGACLNGGTSCAAAEAPQGMRQVLKGHRMVKTQWVQKTNKESGAPDIGVKAEWEPVSERR